MPRFFPTGYTATYPVQKGEIKPQFIQIPILIGAIISVGFALWDAYDAYNVCSDYGGDSIKCTVAAGSVFVFSLAIEGDEIVSVFRHGDELVEVPGRLYSTLKRLDIVEEIDQGLQKARFVNERFAHIFDDIVKHGDDAAKALDDLVRAGVSKEAVEEAVKHGATIKGVKEGIERFAKSTSSIKNSHGYTIVIERGNERYGLIHGWLRHVHGYEMDYKRETSFFPMGQEIVYYVNGQRKVMKLPKTIQSPEELYNEIVRLTRQYKDLLRPNMESRPGTIILTKPSNLPGITEITVVFKRRGSTYKLITFWPDSGSAVWVYKNGKWIRRP